MSKAHEQSGHVVATIFLYIIFYFIYIKNDGIRLTDDHEKRGFVLFFTSNYQFLTQEANRAFFSGKSFSSNHDRTVAGYFIAKRVQWH